MGESVKVAVRVRPFSSREKSRKAQRIVDMKGATTYLFDPQDPKSKPREFTFDYSYWSHDGYKVEDSGYCQPDNLKYADQIKVFQDLGEGMINNAMKGYNCSIFAYGQTGSGKSYTIMGHGANKGLVPRVCEMLFEKVEAMTSSDNQTEVSISMLEIYNEQVRDLLSKKKPPPGGLKVKENPGKGLFFVEGLSVVPVGNYGDVRIRMDEGERQRTIAATKMNETSSRAHTIVTLKVTQKSKKANMTKYASINLVDLAGSERAKQTEATGDRFEEAKNINKSLMTLGILIKGLCDKAKGAKSAQTPYRDSVLTKLLKNALGGNSKTAMIAAISPDAENYEQTLSTLKYADRAKSIKTVARVNQAETNKMIQELIAEKERLLKELKNAKAGERTGISQEELDQMKDEQLFEIQRYKEQMEDSEKSWQKRLEEARKEIEEMRREEARKEEEEKIIPHLSNLNEDPALTGKITHLLKPGDSTLGNGKEASDPDIKMNGPMIARNHAVMKNVKNTVTIRPSDGAVKHNGQELTKEVTLQHQDRLLFGSNNLFVFINPKEAAERLRKGHKPMEITYDYAQSEIAQHSGIDLSGGDGIQQSEVMSLMQLVNNVNAMAEELEKPVIFNIVLVSAEAQGLSSGRTEIFVRMVDLETDNEYLWDRNKILNRQCHMQELYQQYQETGDIPDVPKERDPFWEPHDTPVMVGIALAPLNYIAHMVEFEGEPLSVIDYKAKQAGFLKVDLIPCTAKGNEDVDLTVENPIDLVGKPMAFKVKIHQAMTLPERFQETWCQYKLNKENEGGKTKPALGINPAYNHERIYSFGRGDVSHKFIDYLKESSLAVQIWGKQGNKQKQGAARRKNETSRKLQEEAGSWKKKADEYKDTLVQIKKLVKKGDHNALGQIARLLEDAGI